MTLTKTFHERLVAIARVEHHRSAMQPMVEQGFGNEDPALAACAKPKPELPVLVTLRRHVYRVAPDRFPILTTEDAGHRNEVAIPQLREIERLCLPYVVPVAE